MQHGSPHGQRRVSHHVSRRVSRQVSCRVMQHGQWHGQPHGLKHDLGRVNHQVNHHDGATIAGAAGRQCLRAAMPLERRSVRAVNSHATNRCDARHHCPRSQQKASASRSTDCHPIACMPIVAPGRARHRLRPFLRSRLAPERPSVPPGQRSIWEWRPSSQICLPRSCPMGCHDRFRRETICNPEPRAGIIAWWAVGKARQPRWPRAGWGAPHVSNHAGGARGRLHW